MRSPQFNPAATSEPDRRLVGRDDISIAVPSGWSRASDLDHGILMAARAPTAPGSGFVPRFVLDAEPVDSSFESWQENAVTALSDQLQRFDEEDTDDYHVGPELARYRRVSHVSSVSSDHHLVSEQWCWLIEGVGFTLTGTIAREDFADFCDLFEDVAGTFSVRRRPSA